MKTRAEPVPEILRFLGNIPLFSQVTEASSRSLAKAGTFQTLQKGKCYSCGPTHVELHLSSVRGLFLLFCRVQTAGK